MECVICHYSSLFVEQFVSVLFALYVVMVATSLQFGERLNAVSTLPRLLAVVWAAYYARTLHRIGHRSKSTCFTAAGVSMAIVSTATTATTELGASEKKND